MPSPLAGLLLLLAILSPASAQTAEPPQATIGSVSVKYGDYQRLVARRREVEARLARDGRHNDAVVARARYDVKLGAESATVTARLTVKTLRADGWKILPLVGGAVAVSRFEAPMKDSYLVTREMLTGGEAGLKPGMHYLLTAGGESGDLVMEFVVPMIDEGGVRRAQFVPPAVPLSTMDVRAPAGHVSIQPNALVSGEDGPPTGPRTVSAAIRGGEPLSIALMPLEMAPATPTATRSPAPASAPPQAEIVIDQLQALFSLGDGRLKVRERLAIDVRAVPVDRLVLRKPMALAEVRVREESATPVLEDALASQPLDPEGRKETVELKLRAPVSNRVIRLVLDGTLRADPDRPEMELAPIGVEGAREVIEGHAAVVSLLPHPIELADLTGATRIDAAQLPPSFGLPDAPVRAAMALTSPTARFKLKQEVLEAPPAVRGIIQRMEITTDLAGEVPRSHYRLMVSAPPGAQLTFAFPEDNVKYEIGKLMGAVAGFAQPIGQNKSAIPLKAGGSEPVPVEFELRHVGESLRLSGSLSLPLLRFDFPARNVRWTVVERDGMRFWNWGGTFADRAPARDVFLQRFAIGVWAWLGHALMAFTDPTALFWIVVMMLGITLARSAALGRMPLDASIGQVAFLAGIVVLGAVFVHVLTTAANPGPALSDGRGDHRRLEDARTAGPPPPRGYSGLEEAAEMRRAGLAEDAPPATRAAESPSPSPSPTSVMSAPSTAPRPVAGEPPPAATITAAPAPVELHPVFARAAVPGGTDERWLTLDAHYMERKLEPLVTGFAMIVGLALFMAAFLALRQLLDVPSTNLIGGGALALMLYLDVAYPFAAPYAATGFALPVVLLGAVRAMGHALDTWDAWREEGERSMARSLPDTSRSSETSRSWSASFPRSTERNEVPIKEIFADAPAAGGDEISFVSEDEEPAAEADPATPAASPDQGGEPR